MRMLLFRIMPEAFPKVWRTVRIGESHTLHDLHRMIHEAYGLKGSHLYAFYLSRKRWDINNEYGSPGSGAPQKTNKTPLGKLALEKGRRFLYVFDFHKEFWFEIEFIDEMESSLKESSPKVIEKYGEYNMQHHGVDHLAYGDLKNIVYHLNKSINARQAARQKPRTPTVLEKDYQLVRKLYNILKDQGEERWMLLEEATELRLVDWLLSMPQDLTNRKMIDEALEVCDFFSAFADKEHFLCEKAIVLARAGKREKALSQISENMSSFTLTPRLFAKSAEAYWKLNEIGHAERYFRAGLDLAADDIYEREQILDRLVTMLEEHERSDEATELLRAEMDRG